jgi:hypothetical protein
MIDTGLSDGRKIVPGNSEVGSQCGGTWVSGRYKKLFAQRALGNFPRQRMLSSARTKDQYIHRSYSIIVRAKDSPKNGG